VLIERLAADQEGGPSIAVEASSQDGRPEIVLFTTLEVDRYTANRHIRRAGLSPLHNIRRVIKLPQLPVLGTGKTDYRALRESLQGGRK
jgi:long-chain-fatty-acid--[acyl-carrier-protein] ligase